MNDFSFLVGVPNIASLVMVEYAAAVGVSSFPPVVNGAINSALTFVNGYGWRKVFGAMEGKGFNEQGAQSVHGLSYESEVRLFYPGDSLAVRAQIEAMNFHQFVLRLKDQNGFTRIVGKPWNPLEIAFKFQTGEVMGEERGYQIVWKGSSSNISPVYLV